MKRSLSELRDTHHPNNPEKSMVGNYDVFKEAFAAFEPLQRGIAVDTDVNLYDSNDVNWAVISRFNPDRDLIILPNQTGHILNPMVTINPDGKGGTVTKMGMDATAPFPRTDAFRRVSFMDLDLEKYDIIG